MPRLSTWVCWCQAEEVAVVVAAPVAIAVAVLVMTKKRRGHSQMRSHLESHTGTFEPAPAVPRPISGQILIDG